MYSGPCTYRVEWPVQRAVEVHTVHCTVEWRCTGTVEVHGRV